MSKVKSFVFFFEVESPAVAAAVAAPVESHAVRAVGAAVKAGAAARAAGEAEVAGKGVPERREPWQMSIEKKQIVYIYICIYRGSYYPVIWGLWYTIMSHHVCQCVSYLYVFFLGNVCVGKFLKVSENLKFLNVWRWIGSSEVSENCGFYTSIWYIYKYISKRCILIIRLLWYLFKTLAIY